MQKLDAVNIALTACNLPVAASISPATSPVAEQASLLVDQLNRKHQARGWWFNYSLKYTYTPDGSGNIAIASTILSVQPWDQEKIYAIRDGQLYDMGNNTNVFSGNVDVTQITLIDFDDAPPVWQEYIAYEAALQLHQKVRGDSGSSRTVLQERDRAWSTVNSQDTRARKRNIRYSHNYWRSVKKYRD